MSDLRKATAGLLGEMMLEMSALDFSISLHLRNSRDGAVPETANEYVQKLRFNRKIDLVSAELRKKAGTDVASRDEIRAWRDKAHEVRERRNTFVHGRWGIVESQALVVSVAPGLPGEAPQVERRYNVRQLEVELEHARAVSAEFSRLAKKYRV